MTFATTKFKKGDRVQQTKSWDDHSGYNSRKKQRTGTVVGFSRNRKLVWIIPDGTKTRTAWHPDYWAAVKPILPKPAQPKPIHFGGDACRITEAELDLSSPYGVVLEPKQTPAPKSGWLDRFIGFLLGISWSNFISLTKSDSRK